MTAAQCHVEYIAVLSGGQVISEDLGIKLENVTLDMLGCAKRCRIEKENTTIIDGVGKRADIDRRCSSLSGRQVRATPRLHPKLHPLGTGGVFVAHSIHNRL
jgi:chaperonin GroEL (HSP60 family)